MNRREAIKESMLFTGLLALSSKLAFTESKTNIHERKKIIRKIAQLGNKVLRVKSKSISQTDIKKNIILKDLIEDMIISLKDSGGVGLASPQVYEDVSLFIFVNDMEKFNFEVAINPKILNYSKEKVLGYEGCLSIPGIRATVPRYKSIEVEYINIDNKKIRTTYSDFIARIFQHEFDHLQGIVYLDRLSSNKDIITEEEYKKLPKEAKKR